MFLSEYLARVRLDLNDQDENNLRFSEDELTRGVQRALDDLNRWLPQEKLAADTDVTWDPAALTLDITALTDLIRVEAVEWILSTLMFPRRMATWKSWGSIIYLTAVADDLGQRTLPASTTLSIYYQATHVMPDSNSDGTIPVDLGEVLIKGADGYTLLMRVIELAFLSKDGISNAILQLTAAEAAQTDVLNALTDSSAALAAVIAALDALHTDLLAIDTTIPDIDTTILDAVDIDLQAELAILAAFDADIISDLEAIFTAVDVDLAQASSPLSTALSSLGAGSTYLTSADNHLGSSLATAIAAMASDLSSAAAGLGDLDREIAFADGNAADSRGLINKVNVGLDPSGQHARLAEMHVQAAAVANRKMEDYLSAAALRARQMEAQVADGSAYVNAAQVAGNQASMAVAAANGYLNRASTRLQKAPALVSAIQAKVQAAMGRITLDQARVEAAIAAIQARIQVVQARVTIATQVAQALVAEVQARVQAALGYVSLSAQYVENVKQYLAVADGHMAAAAANGLLADRFKLEGEAYLSQFLGILQDRQQMRRDKSVVSSQQVR